MIRPCSLHRGRLAALGMAAAASVVTAVLLPTASAAPIGTDERGFVGSTARCTAPSKAVVFGLTANSRVAICKDETSGQFQYRGVRVSDGARLILPATPDGDGFVAENDGITYSVTSSALVISAGQKQVRKEPMVDFHGQGAGSGSVAPTSQSIAAPASVAPTTPLAPPLPAEVGGG